MTGNVVPQGTDRAQDCVVGFYTHCDSLSEWVRFGGFEMETDRVITNAYVFQQKGDRRVKCVFPRGGIL